MSFVDSIYMGLVFVSVQPVFWLEHFNPFTFKVITDMYVLIAVLLIWGMVVFVDLGIYCLQIF